MKHAQNFDKLLSLASESRINAHQMHPFMQNLQRFKRNQSSLFSLIEQLHEAISNSDDAGLKEKSLLALQKTHPLKQFVLEHIADIEAYERRLLGVSQSMVDEVLTMRMRPSATACSTSRAWCATSRAARQGRAAANHRRRHAGRPRHPGQDREPAQPHAAQRHRPRHGQRRRPHRRRQAWHRHHRAGSQAPRRHAEYRNPRRRQRRGPGKNPRPRYRPQDGAGADGRFHVAGAS
jgi:hypothetical protein